MPVLKIIWMALLACVAIYGGVLWQMAAMWEKPERLSMQQLAANPIVLVLALMGLLSLVMAFTIPNMMMRGHELTQDTIRVRSIVQWALIETVAIYGLVGAIITRDPRIFIAFGSVAILGFLLTFPSAERMSTPF
jgi:hypothetical protein